jgi:hypothetical protein
VQTEGGWLRVIAVSPCVRRIIEITEPPKGDRPRPGSLYCAVTSE